MKQAFFLFAIIVFISSSFTSCKRCQVCTKPNSNEIRVCEKDYNSNTEYGFAIDVYEAGGYDCKNSL